MRKNNNDPQSHFNGPPGPQGPPANPQGYINVPPSEPSKPEKKKRRWMPVAGVGVGAFIFGAIVGGAAGGEDSGDPQMSDTEVHESAPTPTAKDAPAPTETETVEVASEDCEVALTHADNAIDIYSQALIAAGDGIIAYSEGNYDLMDEKTAEIEAMQGELTNTLTDYYINRDECKGQAGS